MLDLGERGIGGPKYYDEKWLEYAKRHEAQWKDNAKLYGTDRIAPLRAVEAAEEGSLSTLMGSVWCENNPVGDKNLVTVKNSLLDGKVDRKMSVSSASTVAYGLLGKMNEEISGPLKYWNLRRSLKSLC